ncbi:MAG: hypothetical protein NT090_26070 [Acidobacteria bacterium]|nr:hypothetical protein [Acidobacteriota bacterium]
MRYESALRLVSASTPGVRFTIRKISFGRRTELLRRVRELTRKIEFLEAGQRLASGGGGGSEGTPGTPGVPGASGAGAQHMDVRDGSQVVFGEALGERAEAALLGREADRVYLEWGLVSVEGLEIDGEAATLEGLIASGPEPLCDEILRAIQAECGLSAEERKN